MTINDLESVRMVEQARRVYYQLASESPISLLLPGSEREVVIIKHQRGVIIKCNGLRLNPAELEFLYSQNNPELMRQIVGYRRRALIEGLQERNTLLFWKQAYRIPTWQEIAKLADEYGLLDPIFVEQLFNDILKTR